jgi:hypothetical protein
MRRRLLALVAVLLIALATAGAAQADRSWSTSCGGTGVALNPGWGDMGGHYVVPQLAWQQNCGNGKTIEVELQETTDGGNHWIDANCSAGCVTQDYQFSTPADLANHLVTRLSTNFYPTYCGNHSMRFRIHVWWSGGDDPGNSVAGPQSC